MPQYQMKLAGWQIIAVGLILLAVVGARLASLGEQEKDSELIEKLKFEIMTEYFPDDVERLKAAMASGDRQLIDDTASSITSSQLTLESIQASYPLLSFSPQQRVVVKVRYSLDDAKGNRQRATLYYAFDHTSLGNRWTYRHQTTVVSYYLNFF